jgi:hypothetical protein
MVLQGRDALDQAMDKVRRKEKMAGFGAKNVEGEGV